MIPPYLSGVEIIETYYSVYVHLGHWQHQGDYESFGVMINTLKRGQTYKLLRCYMYEGGVHSEILFEGVVD
jgi:hypothetical protein